MSDTDRPPTTLIATVGKSPGAVTGLYKALVDADPALRPDAMLLITTEGDPEIDRSLGYIRQGMQQRYHVGIDQGDVYRIPDMDIGSGHAARSFQKLVADAVEERIERGHRVVLNITGGRASMGAMLALAGHLYHDSVDAMYHLQVTSDVEKMGTLERVGENEPRRNDVQRRDYERGMFPPPEEYQLVPLPRFDLSFTSRWVKEVSSLEAALKAQQARADAAEDAYLKLAGGVLEGLPGRVGFAEAFQMRDIMQGIARGERAPQEELPAIARILQATGLVETQDEIENWFYDLPAGELEGEEFTTAWLTWLMEKSRRSRTPFLSKLFTRDQEELQRKLETAELRRDLARVRMETVEAYAWPVLKVASFVAIHVMAWHFKVVPLEIIGTYWS